MKQTIILLPPSEGKQEGGEHPPIKKLSPVTIKIIQKLKRYDGSLEKLYGVKEEFSEQAHKINLAVDKSPAMPAIERYTGVVFQALDYPTLSKPGLCHEHVYFISTLFGLIRADQPIPNYKLKIDKLGIAAMWKEEITKQLEPYHVIDLLPQAQRKAVSYTDGIQVEFVIYKNGKKMPAGHFGKLIKGRFVRWLLEHHLPSITQFKQFQEEGYLWNGNEFIKEVSS